jgi:hypothetical protein
MRKFVLEWTSVLVTGVCAAWCCAGVAQPGTEDEPVRYVGKTEVDLTTHEAGLRPAIGTANYQVLRVNRTHPEWAEGSGWTYNHAPMMAYWNDTFYVEYLSNPVDEHIAPGQTLVATSRDGHQWNKPVVVFPPYEPPAGTPMPKGYSGYMMHQRMGFYAAPNRRLLVVAFYGHAEDPFEEGGIGRVVREAYKDGTFGPIYFIRYSSHTKWNESNTSHPLYTRSEDAGFVEACNALLADKLKTLQWWDEDRGLDGFYSVKEAGPALSYYHRKDGKVVALWKRSRCALSSDEGASFSKPVKVPTLVMAGGKVWGQRTDDGRYALVYNPTKYDEYRYPLIVITGDDGITFDNMLLVHGEVPPRRFYGRWKDFGPCYVRGIVEGNGNPPGDDMWVTYSMNKEDIWVSRVPAPVRYRVEGVVNDTFDGMEAGGNVVAWNIYAPIWAPVAVTAFPDAANKSLELQDKDPCDYARAVRVFQEGSAVEVRFQVLAKQENTGMLDVEIVEGSGKRPVRVRFDADGLIKAMDGQEWKTVEPYDPDEWHEVSIAVDTRTDAAYRIEIDGEPALERASFAEPVQSVERISFRTGPYRDQPTRQTPNQIPGPPLPDCDEPVPLAVFYVDNVIVAAPHP